MGATSAAEIVERNKKSSPDHEFIELGESVLRVSTQEEGVVIGWLSSLSINDFVRGLGATLDTVPRIAISRPSEDSPKIKAERLADPSPLSEKEQAAIYLIREDIDEETAIVYEPDTDGVSEVTVCASSMERGFHEIHRFIPEPLVRDVYSALFYPAE